MRYRKLPKVVEVVSVANILAGDVLPYWLTKAIKVGKVSVQAHKIGIFTANQLKIMDVGGFIAWDAVQSMVYGVSKQTLQKDYERLEDEVVK